MIRFDTEIPLQKFTTIIVFIRKYDFIENERVIYMVWFQVHGTEDIYMQVTGGEVYCIFNSGITVFGNTFRGITRFERQPRTVSHQFQFLVVSSHLIDKLRTHS